MSSAIQQDTRISSLHYLFHFRSENSSWGFVCNFFAAPSLTPSHGRLSSFFIWPSVAATPYCHSALNSTTMAQLPRHPPVGLNSTLDFLSLATSATCIGADVHDPQLDSHSWARRRCVDSGAPCGGLAPIPRSAECRRLRDRRPE